MGFIGGGAVPGEKHAKSFSIAWNNSRLSYLVIFLTNQLFTSNVTKKVNSFIISPQRKSSKSSHFESWSDLALLVDELSDHKKIVAWLITSAVIFVRWHTFTNERADLWIMSSVSCHIHRHHTRICPNGADRKTAITMKQAVVGELNVNTNFQDNLTLDTVRC